MCEPSAATAKTGGGSSWTAAADLVSQGAGMATSAIGSFSGASGRKAGYEADASINVINARLAELTAQSALRAGQTAEQTQRLKTAQIRSSQRAGYASSGVALDSDTVQRVLATTDIMGETDAQTIKNNALRSAWGYRTMGVNYTGAAGVSSAQASGISPFSAGMTSLLTDAPAMASSFYNFRKAVA